MADAKYRNVMRLCMESPWAIRAEKLAVIREMLILRASGDRFSRDEIEARIGAGPSQKPASRAAGVAILPVYGVITPKAGLMSEMSGGTSVQGLSASLRAALADDSVGSILLDVDSPGGMTDLVPELAAEIRDARGVKPITAIANTDAASAAYWLASQADEVVVTPSAMVGSIGVFAAHEDISAQQEQDGITTTLVSAGKYKTESNPFGPLTDEARAVIQARVDSFYGMFVSDVALGRGVSADEVRGGFGEGRVVTAADAVGMGMADRVDTFEATVKRMITQNAGGARVQMASVNMTVLESYASGAPPGFSYTTSISEAPDGSLTFVQAASALRGAAIKLTADAGSLRDLTAAKRDALSLVAESLEGSAAALVELVARSDADPVSDVLVRRLLADAQRRHFQLGVTE